MKLKEKKDVFKYFLLKKFKRKIVLQRGKKGPM
jgi:hypothetical protein